MGALLCQDHLEDVKRHVLRVLPHVDNYIIVDNGSNDGTFEWLSEFSAAHPRVTLVSRRWNDSFADARNAYMAVAEAMADARPDAPVFIAAADVDELYSDALLEDLREIAKWAALEDLNVIEPLSMNADLGWNGRPVAEWRGGYYKPLMFVWEPGMRYEDAPGHFHEDLKTHTGWRLAHLDDADGRYFYRHAKPYGEIWLRATRNFFAGGGGPNLGERNPLWRPFRALFERVGITTSDQMRAYLQKGEVDPDILRWFVEHRLLGTPFDPTPPMWAEWPDGTSEVREGFLAYYVYLHPERMCPDWVEADRHYMDYASEVRTIHGPKSPGWAAYA